MNKGNRLEGQNIARHPLVDTTGHVGLYVKGVTVIAVQAQVAGVVVTPEGEMTFQAGDYILTDNPPSHAWPVRQQVFETTYELHETLRAADAPEGEITPPIDVPEPSLPPVYPGRVADPSEIAPPTAGEALVDPVGVAAADLEGIAVRLSHAEQDALDPRLVLVHLDDAIDHGIEIREQVGQDHALVTHGDAREAQIEWRFPKVDTEPSPMSETQLDDSVSAPKEAPEPTTDAQVPADTLPTGPGDQKPAKKSKKGGTADSSSLEALG